MKPDNEKVIQKLLQQNANMTLVIAQYEVLIDSYREKEKEGK